MKKFCLIIIFLVLVGSLTFFFTQSRDGDYCKITEYDKFNNPSAGSYSLLGYYSTRIIPAFHSDFDGIDYPETTCNIFIVIKGCAEITKNLPSVEINAGHKVFPLNIKNYTNEELVGIKQSTIEEPILLNEKVIPLSYSDVNWNHCGYR